MRCTKQNRRTIEWDGKDMRGMIFSKFVKNQWVDVVMSILAQFLFSVSLDPDGERKL